MSPYQSTSVYGRCPLRVVRFSDLVVTAYRLIRLYPTDSDTARSPRGIDDLTLPTLSLARIVLLGAAYETSALY